MYVFVRVSVCVAFGCCETIGSCLKCADFFLLLLFAGEWKNDASFVVITQIHCLKLCISVLININ